MSSLFPFHKYPALHKALKDRPEELEMLFRVCSPELLQSLEGYATHNPEWLELALCPIWRELAKKTRGE